MVMEKGAIEAIDKAIFQGDATNKIDLAAAYYQKAIAIALKNILLTK